MLKSGMLRIVNKYWLFLPVAIAILLANPANSQESTPTTNPTETSTEKTTPQSSGILSLEGGKKLMSEAEAAINSQQYDVAAEKLQNARQVFNQLSNFYLQLFNSFSGLENRIAEKQRAKALETGQLRDEATYQLALVHRSQDKPELSVPLLIQVIGSQNPSSELGKKAYQQLYEIGFVEDPFSGVNRNNSNGDGTTEKEK
jgi:hypothetical protein